MIKFLLNKNNQGFSLIELLLIFVFIAGMTVSVLKQLKKKTPSSHDLILQISEVTQEVFLKSILENNPYTIHLFFNENNLLTDIGYAIKDKNQNTEPLIQNKKKLKYPFYVHNCFINGKDEMAIKSKEIWLYFYPEGFCQEVKFVISKNYSEIKHTYHLNPFNGIIED